jgi:hypothetical protein
VSELIKIGTEKDFMRDTVQLAAALFNQFIKDVISSGCNET